MPRAEPGKKAEARRLVEEERLSLAAAADQVEVNRSTVRAWQKADEEAGNPWRLWGLSAAQKERQANLTPEDRLAETERARRATRTRWIDRRGEEADHQGTLTGGMRIGSAEALTALRQAIAARDPDQAVKWARTLRDLAVTGAIHADKADKLADVAAVASIVAVGDETYQNDLAEVLSLVDRIDRERRSG